MGLTSGWFAALLIAAAVGTVAGAVLLWPRARGPRPLRAALRVGMIMMCQLTAILVVMVTVNNEYGFYASWDDLLGHANSGTAGPAAQGAPAPAVPDYAVKFASYSQGFERATVHGWDSGTKGDVIVWLPPQYAKPEFAHTRFPVIEVLHGIPGTPHSFLRGMRLGRIMQDQISAGRAEPAILVLPTITPDRVNTGCADVAGKSKVGTWLTDDVVKTISRNFRTLPAPRGWAVMGISTGGYCAARLALEHPETFAAGAALAPDDPVEGRALTAVAGPQHPSRRAAAGRVEPSGPGEPAEVRRLDHRRGAGAHRGQHPGAEQRRAQLEHLGPDVPRRLHLGERPPRSAAGGAFGSFRGTLMRRLPI